MQNYQTQQLIETITTMMMMAMGVRTMSPILLQQSKTPYQTEELTGSEQVILYHATLTRNVPSVVSRGLIPRTEEFCNNLIDTVLAEYGLTRATCPKWRWKYPLDRCLESTQGVFLTAGRGYAIQNCRAGLEAEVSLRMYALSHKRHKLTIYPKDRLEWIKENPCSVCSFRLTLDELLSMIYDRESEWERRRFDRETYKRNMREMYSKRIKRCKENARIYHHPEEECILQDMVGNAVLGRVPSGMLVSCEPVPTEEDIEYRWWSKREIEKHPEIRSIVGKK